MDKKDIQNIAEQIASHIIDKTFWGNEWFFLFTLLLVVIVFAILTWVGAYLISRAQNEAMMADFERALSQLREQTEAVKKIEENIAYNYWEKRGKLSSFIRQICENNAERSNTQWSILENEKHSDEGKQLISKFIQAKINIELTLEDQMKKLNQTNAVDEKNSAAD